MISSTHDFVGPTALSGKFRPAAQISTGSQRKYRVSPVRLRNP